MPGFGAAVVDLTGEAGTEIRTYTTGPGDLAAPWGDDSTFEIASITKPFTAIATLILEEEGVLSRDTTIGELLPCDWDMANSDVASITLVELIKHTSGLPAQPPDRGPSIGGNPFAGYSQDRLCASLLKLNGLPTRGRYSYSNYAYGTLGYVLTLAVDAANPPAYEDVIKDKILTPLGMTNTSVTYTDAEWANAAEGCSRGINRGSTTIRLGLYETLQGNGALRSTLNDMAVFLWVALYVDAGLPTPVDEAVYGGLPAPSDALTKVYNAMTIQHGIEGSDLACSCVSDWCEGSLCELPNPNGEFITLGGIEGYTSGGVPGWRKSGDTGGYSLRAAWSATKGRAAIAVDTCGGCGGRGTAGSASQRAALLLADGPPVTISASEQSVDSSMDMVFTGDALSQVFPSVSLLKVELKNEMMLSVSSSDGTGITVPVTARDGNSYAFTEPVHFGTGWGASGDPFTTLSQQRSLVISGNAAYLQDMGADTILEGGMEPSDTSGSTGLSSFTSVIVYMTVSLVYFMF